MTQTPEPLTQRHYDALDGLRGFLAIYVVIDHALLGAYLTDPKHMNQYFLLLAWGRERVICFIVLSGFCLMLATLKTNFTLAKGLWAYAQRRARRILPPYYVGLLISLAMFLPINHLRGGLWDIVLPVTYHNFVTHVLLIHNFFSNDFYKINGAYWTMPMECQLYFIFPVLLLGWRWMGPIPTTVLAAVGSIVLENELQRRFQIQPCAHFIGLFALGMWAAYVGTSTAHKNLPWRSIALAACLGFATTFHYQDQAKSDLIFGFVAALLLVVIFVRPQDWLHRGLNWRPLVFLGSFSYSIYLMHVPVLLIFWVYIFPSFTHPALMWLTLILIGLPVTVGVGYLFHLVIEKPFLTVRQRKLIHVP